MPLKGVIHNFHFLLQTVYISSEHIFRLDWRNGVDRIKIRNIVTAIIQLPGTAEGCCCPNKPAPCQSI